MYSPLPPPVTAPYPLASIPPTDEELKIAASEGDVSILKKCADSQRYLIHFRKTSYDDRCGNILHLAAKKDHHQFIEQVCKTLQWQVLHELLLQQCVDYNWFNPLHVAAFVGNLDIVKSFLSIYDDPDKVSGLPPNQKPWLQRDCFGNSPCHHAVLSNNESCGLEILKKDLEGLCLWGDGGRNTSLLYEAMLKGYNDIALEILKSRLSFSYMGPNGFTALHVVPNCSNEEICRLLLDQIEPGLITQRAEGGLSALHSWVYFGKLQPFKLLFAKKDIISDVTRKRFVLLINEVENQNGYNPLHYLLACNYTSSEEDALEIATYLIKDYRQEAAAAQGSSHTVSEHHPWLTPSNQGWTPLSLSIYRRYQDFAIYLLSVDNTALLHQPVLFFALEMRCPKLALKILDIVDDQNWSNQLLVDQKHWTALHFAPLCTDQEFCARLLKQHPHLLSKTAGSQNITVLHKWFEFGEVWPFNLVLQSDEKVINNQWKRIFSTLISNLRTTDKNNPLHVGAANSSKAMDEVIKHLIEDYQTIVQNVQPTLLLPCFVKNYEGDAPLTLALKHKRQELALYFLSLYDLEIEGLLDHYKPEHCLVFLAIENDCFEVAKGILNKLEMTKWCTYATNESDGRNILHIIAPSFINNVECVKKFGEWVIANAPSEYITQRDNISDTPLDAAADAGAEWIITAILRKDSASAFTNAPLAWAKACEKGHFSAFQAFIDAYEGDFKAHCHKHKDSPLHYIDKLPNVADYETFLNIQGMKDLINLKDSRKETPLHKAIRRNNIHLTDALLKMDGIQYNIKDDTNTTAIKLLNDAFNKNPNDWEQVCRNAGFPPKVKARYFQRKKDMPDVRNTLSVVAALLATITFTAGFTLPGGFNQENGEAIMAKKAAFIVFLIADTLAMCCSMLVLISLIWSMVYDGVNDSDKSFFMIDRSMSLLLIALYSTLLAFMTGVYVVISPKTLWPAILVIVMCSLIIFAVKQSFFYKVLNNLIPSAKRNED